MQTNDKKYYLKLVEVSANGSTAELGSIPTDADAFGKIELLAKDYERVSKGYETYKNNHDFLRNLYENTTLLNERMIAAFFGVLCKIQVYDQQNNTINLDPILRPLFNKYMGEYTKNVEMLGFFAQRWQEFIIDNGLDGRGIMVKFAVKAVKFLINFITKKSMKANG